MSGLRSDADVDRVSWAWVDLEGSVRWLEIGGRLDGLWTDASRKAQLFFVQYVACDDLDIGSIDT